MVAPVAKGIIVATTLLLAAGLAAYENEQIRAWIEVQRRRIAVVLTGNAASPESEKDERERERQADEIALQLRDEVIRRHRDEIFERARKEGVAVDWDELAAVEKIYEEQSQKAAADAGMGVTKRRSAQSFDELVGSDGMLRERDITSGVASGVAGSSSVETVRQRGATGFGRGASFANPFDDEAQLLFDQELIGAGGEELAGISRTSNTSNAIAAEEDLRSLVDVHESPYKSDVELEDEINEAIRRSLEDADRLEQERNLITIGDDTPLTTETPRSHTLEPPASYHGTPSLQNSLYQSYYYNGQAPRSAADSLTSSTFLSATASPSASTHTLSQPSPYPLQQQQQQQDQEEDSDDALTPAGTLTPTTEAGFSYDGDSDLGGFDDRADEDEDSLYGEPSTYQSFSVGDMLGSRLREEQERRSRSSRLGAAPRDEEEVESSDGFSVVEGEGEGAHTPGSWTDVESVGGFEEEEGVVGREGSASTAR